MLNVGFAADREACRLQPTHTKLQAIERHDFRRVPADVVHKACQVEDTCRYFSLELCVPREDNDGPNGFGWQEIEEILHSPHMTKVLVDRVLKTELAVEKDLRPTGLLGVGKDPALVVLGLDDEDTVAGDEDVIDLRGAILQRERDVIQQLIVGRREVQADRVGKKLLAAVLIVIAVCTISAQQEADKESNKNVEECGHRNSLRASYLAQGVAKPPAAGRN